MSYLVLARKYRPKTFDEVVGQDVVTSTLRGAITEGRIGHAYLFTGPRGTGKTTCARLFAKALNCEQGPTPEPCGECERCLAADTGTEVDLFEIDAASNTGVDDVRKLRQQAAYMPLRARFKVYLLDEVHMLSTSAFNALLKTLEEPPPHVKFLFATTEPHKIPETVRSRCQVLQLVPIPEATISKKLSEIFSAEGVDVEAGVADELARRARGGMRDALSLADQLLALVGASPRLTDVELLSSEGSTALVEEVIRNVLAGEPAAVISALPDASGREAELLTGILDHLRACLVAALCGVDAPLLPGGNETRAALVERGRQIGAPRLELWLQELLHARERMRLLPSHARLVLEITLLELCRPEATLDLAEIGDRLLALEGRLAGVTPPARNPAAAAPSARTQAPDDTAPAAPPVRVQPSPARASSEPAPAAQRGGPGTGPGGGARVRTNSTADAWSGFLEELGSSSAALAELLRRRGRLVQYGGGRAVIKVVDLLDEERLLITGPRALKRCTKAFSDAVGQALEVTLEDAAETKPGDEDVFTREVVDLFDGRVED
ncbi:MAG: DNA polymerase III subunit gamma/tau [Planctomycetota bacterium]|nr:MAG: DNA polymerase III subunit gamma/tau [Planctomycetota bacterium]